jgi:hypothetical protein
MSGTVRQLARHFAWAQARTFSGVITPAGGSSNAGGSTFPAATAAFLGGAVTAAILGGASVASASSPSDNCSPALGSCGKPVPLTPETLQPYTGTWLMVRGLTVASEIPKHNQAHVPGACVLQMERHTSGVMICMRRFTELLAAWMHSSGSLRSLGT